MKKLDNLINSGFVFSDDEYELKSKYILFNSMLAILALALFIMGNFRMITGFYIQGLIDYITVLTAIVYIILLRKAGKGNYKPIAYAMIATSLFVIVYSYYLSNGKLNINAWFTALAIPIFFVLGYRVAMNMALIFMAIIALFNLRLANTDTLSVLYGYVPLFLSVLFLRIYEMRFREFARLLTDANTNLEKKVREKTLERTQVLEQQKSELHYQAHHDYLTKLPNRVNFQKRAREITSKSDINQKSVAVLFIDLDNFKNINDSYGHDIGDKVIKIIASRIKNCIRGNDFLARLGGDEFVVLVEEFENKFDLESMASNIIKCVSKSIKIDKKTMFVACSIGISMYPDDTVSYQDFIKYADTAMYKAKEMGRNNYQFYSNDMTETALERVLMETSMRFALKKEEFVVHYQPQVDSQSGKIVGLEALVRWEQDSMGIVPPGSFIPLAEETGLIIELDQWVMRTGMTQMKKWYDLGIAPGRISFNLSVKQLQRDDFTDTVKKLLDETGCDPKYLEFEVTESCIMDNIDESVSTLKSIRELGIHVAIDDFGTGYSSLSYLKKLPVNKLKIDRSFISGIPENKEDAAITDAIIAVSKSLNLEVVAEGVEKPEQKNYLLDRGCRLIQGFLYYRPMTAPRIEQILKECATTLSGTPARS